MQPNRKEVFVNFKVLLGAILVVPWGGLYAQQHESPPPTPLATLLTEAEANNSEVAAADDGWKALTHVAQQVTALLDSRFTVESLSVGSPLPFAGLGGSEFAYMGLGHSQEVPWQEKLELKGKAADREAETQKANAEIVRFSVAEQVKLVYLRLSYTIATIAFLDRMDSILRSLIQDALSRYGLGQGSRSAVIKAQLEHTRLLAEATMHDEEQWQEQAELKQLVHRPQDSPDIVTEPLTPTAFKTDPQELQIQLRNRNPILQMDARAVETRKAQLAAAQSDGKPDFNFGYMSQRTGGSYDKRYLLTASMDVPRSSRVAGEIAQAEEEANRARHQLDSDVQQKLAELQKQYVAVGSTTRLLDEYRQGLIPQAEAVYHTAQSSYQAGREEFGAVLSALLDLLVLENDHQQVLLDHETALARIETLTGAALR